MKAGPDWLTFLAADESVMEHTVSPITLQDVTSDFHVLFKKVSILFFSLRYYKSAFSCVVRTVLWLKASFDSTDQIYINYGSVCSHV